MQLGMDLVRQAREAAKSNSAPASRDRQMAEAHRAALVRYEGQVRQHQGRIAGAKAGVVAGGAGTAVLGLSTVASAGSPGQMLFFGGLTAGTAALGWRARRRAKDLEASPARAPAPPLPPARLRPGARGADQADRVANALLHLYDLVPNVGRLYPQAGQELWRAVSDVEPLLRGQVERLASLDRIEWEMPGSRAADAAIAAGTEITRPAARRCGRPRGPDRRGCPDAGGSGHRRRGAGCAGPGDRLARRLRPRPARGECGAPRCRAVRVSLRQWAGSRARGPTQPGDS